MQNLRYTFTPAAPDSRLNHVGTYTRTLPVSLDRMYENALDWEHLPHLHDSSFTHIDCLDAGGWGWRAKVTDPRGGDSLLELRLDRQCRRWITRNLEGPNQGAEIWTHVFVTGPHQLDLVIDFFVPDIEKDAREKVGRAYARQYETLYDEDVWMMTERQRQIDLRIDSPRDGDTLTLSVPEAANLPLKAVLSGRVFLLNKVDERWAVYPAVCPHQMGPLTGQLSDSGEVSCPWHGYTFNVMSGECTSGASCRFGRVPQIALDGNTITLSW